MCCISLLAVPLLVLGIVSELLSQLGAFIDKYLQRIASDGGDLDLAADEVKEGEAEWKVHFLHILYSWSRTARHVAGDRYALSTTSPLLCLSSNVVGEYPSAAQLASALLAWNDLVLQDPRLLENGTGSVLLSKKKSKDLLSQTLSSPFTKLLLTGDPTQVSTG